jgi:hypothetical protein
MKDDGYWNIRHTHPISVRAIMISKEPLRGTRNSTREEIIGAVGRSLLDINRSGLAKVYGAFHKFDRRWYTWGGGGYIEGM